MKILLINPPAPDNISFIREGRCTQKSGFWATLWPPITLAYMGAILERDGHCVSIIDSAAEGLSADATIEVMDEFKPDIVICSSSTPSIYTDLAFIAQLKDRMPQTYTAIFGVHASVLYKECMRDCPQLDFVIIGEPENAIGNLINAITTKTRTDNIAGLAYRGPDLAVIVGKTEDFIKDLDAIPFPAWHLIKRGNYTFPLKGQPFLMVLPSRGCPYSCTFCTTQKYYGRKPRFRSVKSVVDEIEHNIDSFGVRQFFFWSETFTFDKNYVLELCREIRLRELDIEWTCNSRVDVADGEMFKAMAEAGCWMVSFGIESASQKILDNVKKGARAKDASRAVILAKDAGLSVVGHFIFGLPGENADTIEETIKFSKSLKLDFAQYYCACPFPGSELYSTALEKGWLTEDDFSKFSQDTPTLAITTATQTMIAEGKARAYREFYMNPTCFLRTLRYINFMDIGNILRLIRQMMSFLSFQKM